MTIPSRAATTLGLIQVVIVIGGYLITRAFVRMTDEVGGYEGEWLRGHYPAFALFVDSFGLWFLLVPIAWAALYSLLGDKRRFAGMDFSDMRVGALVAALLFVFFAYAALMAMHGATTMHGPLEGID